MNFFKIFFAALLAIVVSMVIFFFVFIGGVTGFILSLSSSQEIKSESVLVLDLEDAITDSPNMNPLSMIDFERLTIKSQVTTLDAIRAIERAAMDDKIKGIYISPNSNAQLSLSLLEELRSEVERFKESGKFVVAYSDTYTQGGYYLSSVADSLYLQPEGMVVWQGVAANAMFYKGLLDKLDLNVEIFRPTSCSYKSAVEPLIRRDMSPENRAQNEALVESIWSTVTADVAKSRHTTSTLLNRYADDLTPFIAQGAIKSGLVDRLIYEDEMEDIFESLGVDLNDKGRANRVSLGKYIASTKLLDNTFGRSNEVAVIYAEGAIVDGKGEIGEVGGDALSRVIRRVRADKKVKSVVLRVNSPGGSALASDVIWREVELLRRAKPVVVSMGSYAASGGYYISAPADIVMADRLTITGSIGVYGVLIDMQKSLSSNLGITTDGVKSNTSADFMRSSRPTNATERAVMTRSVDQVYDTFTSHVSKGRNISIDRVLDIAQGRVWSGADALNLGLVDMLGGLKSAILIAAEKGGVSGDFTITEHTTTSEEWGALFAPIEAVAKTLFMPTMNPIAAEYAKIAEELKIFDTKGGVVMFSPLRVEFE